MGTFKWKIMYLVQYLKKDNKSNNFCLFTLKETHYKFISRRVIDSTYCVHRW